MVRYYFSCKNDHIFDVWFKNIAFFEEQFSIPGKIVCPICGCTNISKKIMAPSIIKSNTKKISKNDEKITTDVEIFSKQLNAFKSYIRKNFTYVGKDFKDIAIKMHKGKLEKDNIYGDANKEDIEELTNEGVDILSFDMNIDSKKIN